MKKSILLIIFIFICAAPALAVPFGFSDIPSDDPALDIASNFIGDVSNFGNNQVLISITNSGPVESFIRQIYFEFTPDDLLTSAAFSAANSSGTVVFEVLGNTTLAQGNNIEFSADVAQVAQNPGSKNGINVGETGSFLFNGIYDDVITALNSGGLRIGMHVQGISPGGQSDSYVSTAPVAEPATMLLLGAGLIGLAGFGRKKMMI